jgi:hypothetical protein
MSDDWKSQAESQYAEHVALVAKLAETEAAYERALARIVDLNRRIEQMNEAMQEAIRDAYNTAGSGGEPPDYIGEW